MFTFILKLKFTIGTCARTVFANISRASSVGDFFEPPKYFFCFILEAINLSACSWVNTPAR